MVESTLEAPNFTGINDHDSCSEGAAHLQIVSLVFADISNYIRIHYYQNGESIRLSLQYHSSAVIMWPSLCVQYSNQQTYLRVQPFELSPGFGHF